MCVCVCVQTNRNAVTKVGGERGGRLYTRLPVLETPGGLTSKWLIVSLPVSFSKSRRVRGYTFYDKTAPLGLGQAILG